MGAKDFANLRVLALENRREKEMAALIRNLGGQPTVVPVMREVPIESNHEAIAFGERLMRSEFDIVIFLTGVGARILFNALSTRFAKDDFFAALNRTTIAVRGPKPAAVLRELGIAPKIVSPSPSTWHELLVALDTAYPQGLSGLRIALQEYGAVNQPLLDGLRQRGAEVTQVPVYQWALPENLDQMRATIEALIHDEYNVVLFLSAVQAQHLLQVAERMDRREALLESLRRAVVASIGPDTSEELQRDGIKPDLEPSQPKMGILVNELAAAASRLLEGKRGSRSDARA